MEDTNTLTPGSDAAAGQVAQSANQTPAVNDSKSIDDAKAADIIKAAAGKIIIDLGFEKAPDDEKLKILESITSRVSIAVMKALIGSISEEEARELSEMLEKGESIEEKVAEIVKSKPELRQKIEDALGNLYEKMLSESSGVWQAIGGNEDGTASSGTGGQSDSSINAQASTSKPADSGLIGGGISKSAIEEADTPADKPEPEQTAENADQADRYEASQESSAPAAAPPDYYQPSQMPPAPNTSPAPDDNQGDAPPA